MEIQEQYEVELKQADVDHHTPTAGAMTGHILANLWLHQQKINQARLFAKGCASLFFAQYTGEWLNTERQYFDRINQLLVINGEAVPTTTAQFTQYTMLKENGAQKYAPGKDQLFDLIKDFDTQLLFLQKAIALGKKEGLMKLVHTLVDLDTWMRTQILAGQNFLGNDLMTGRYQEDDDDNQW